MVSGCFKRITFIVHFISNLMPPAADLTGGTESVAQRLGTPVLNDRHRYRN